MADVQRRAERAGDVVNDVARSAGKGVGDMIVACEDHGLGEVGASVAALAGSGERASLRGEVWEETMNQEVMQVVGSFPVGNGVD